MLEIAIRYLTLLEQRLYINIVMQAQFRFPVLKNTAINLITG